MLLRVDLMYFPPPNRQTDTHTYIYTHRDTHAHTYTHIYIHIHTERHIHRGSEVTNV